MMKNYRKPIALRPGDTIGIVSTSSPCPTDALQRMTEYLEGRGYKVLKSQNVLASNGYLAGSAEQRASDLNAMFAQEHVRMILAANGGKGANQLLHLIDWERIRTNPKIFVGLSDPAIIVNAMVSTAGVIGFHGPTGYDFGIAGIHPFSESWFWKIVTGAEKYPMPLDLGKAVVLREGPPVEGPLLGGHLGTVQSILGTRWNPDWDGAILLIEEIFTPWERIDAVLTHFRLAGVLDRIQALIVGQCLECNSETPADPDFHSMILRAAGGKFPVIAEVPLGHTPEKLTLPLGGMARLRTHPLQLELLEPGVAS